MFNQWEISADSIASPSVSVCLPPPLPYLYTCLCHPVEFGYMLWLR